MNNDFLVKTQDPLAVLYNDRSPMEASQGGRERVEGAALPCTVAAAWRGSSSNSGDNKRPLLWTVWLLLVSSVVGICRSQVTPLCCGFPALMQNHHVAAAWTLLKDERYNFLHNLPPKVCSTLLNFVPLAHT